MQLPCTEDETVSIRGTFQYMAPEIFAHHVQNKYSKAVDWWAVGVILVELFTKQLPFSEPTDSSIDNLEARKELIKQRIINAEPKINGVKMRENIRFLALSFLQKDRTMRCTDYKQIQKYAYFSKIDWAPYLSRNKFVN